MSRRVPAGDNWRLGIGGSNHDTSAVIVNDMDIRVAIEQERLSRRKHGGAYWYENPVQRSIDYCLDAEGIGIDDVDAIVAADTIPATLRHALRGRTLREYSHHLCHAASAYLMLPRGTKAGVLVYDGFGSVRGVAPGDCHRELRETLSFFFFGPEGYREMGCTTGLGFIEREEFPIGVTNSIGMFYELVTAMLGYDLMESGKTMGLAAYGTPRYVNVLEQFIGYGTTPIDCFQCRTDDPRLTSTIDELLLRQGGSFSVRADMASSAQYIVNKALLNASSFFIGMDIDHLCLSGGCALNTVATSWLVDHSPLNVPITSPAHCGDAGLGLGAVWLETFERTSTLPIFSFRGDTVKPHLARPGRLYSANERRSAALDFYPRLALDPSVVCADQLAKTIADGAIVGVFNGRSEIGPRALGGRSILADPRSPLIRERLNREMKRREPFRPFAPLVLQSRYSTYFLDERFADPYMLKVARVTPRLASDAPAVVHIDGTSRPQVVEDQEGDPFLVSLLLAFERLTGVGILLNTSFNRRGEPIVESPADAIDAFLGLGLDGLYLDGDYYRAAL